MRHCKASVHFPHSRYIHLYNAVLAFLTDVKLRQTNMLTITSKEIAGLGDNKVRQHRQEGKIGFAICHIIVSLYVFFQDNCCVTKYSLKLT